MILILALSGLYLAFLSVLAFSAHRQPAPKHGWRRAVVYSLSTTLYLGTWFYQRDSIRYFHAIWHLFVLAGSVCHFVAVTAQVL